MVAFLKKPGGSEGFHQIVDFLNSTHIMYAFTENLTIYVSLIHQFWQTASTSTSENGEMEITATIDGRVKTATEASIRRHLKLEDSDGISTLPNTKIFEQLALMGYGEGSTAPVESHHTPTSAPSTSQPPTSTPSMQTTHVTEEAATMPHDSPLPRVNSLGSDEGSITLRKLTVLCTTLSKKVESLESDLKQTKLTYGAAYTKLIMKVKKLENRIKSSKARRRVRLIVSEDEGDLKDPSKQGRKIAQLDEDEGITLFTAPEEVSTASPEVKIAAESLVYIRRSATKRKDKGKAIMKEAETDKIQAQIEVDEELAQKLQAEEREKFSEVEKARLLVEMINERKRLFAQQRAEQRRNKPMTQAQQRTCMCNYIKNMGKSDRLVPKISSRSSKRTAKIELDHEGSKRQKTNEEQSAEEEKELSEKELQKLMMILPVEEVYVEALQVKYPIIDWEVYSEDKRKYWKIIKVGNHTEAYQTFDDMLKKFDRDDLDKLWSLVKERFSSTDPTGDKERTLWVELKRLFEPDIDDILWKLQRYMHDPFTWRL
ncbi:hypothetical protein Tco_0213959 [Tanacetum coccineum]